MGTKRVVDIELWTDELIETFTPEERYFWLFLLTNPATKQCGIYHITKKQMGFYLGYEQDVINKLIERFESQYDLIRYIGNELAIKNYMVHSIVKGGFPIEEQIKRELKEIKSSELIDWVFGCLDTKKDNLTQTIINILNNKELYINANANAYACTHECTQECTQRHQFGEYKNVLLTNEQFEKLKNEFPNDWQDRVDRLSMYMKSTGKVYKDHLATIRNWARKETPKSKSINELYEEIDMPC